MSLPIYSKQILISPQTTQYVSALVPLFLVNRSPFPESSSIRILPIPQILAQVAIFSSIQLSLFNPVRARFSLLWT